VCSKFQEHATSFNEINIVFGLLMPKNLQKVKAYDLDISVSIFMKNTVII